MGTTMMVRAESGEIVRLSPSNWIAIGVFFGTQTFLLVAVGIGMYTRLAVLEDRFEERTSRQTEAIKEIQADLTALKIAKQTSS
jgi:hypothetical protein